MGKEAREDAQDGTRDAAAGEVTLPRAEYDELREKAAKADEHWDRVLRMSADFDNTKKRLEKKAVDAAKFANEKLLVDIVSIIDDLDRAVASLDHGHDLKQVKQGLHLVQNTFHKILEQNGVEVIDTAGKPFDPNLHEAIGETETDAVEEGHVAEELQKGYLLNGRLARPSRVRVAKRKN